MSLILDALRKSEAERRRGQSPDLFAPSAAAPLREAGRPRTWPLLLLGAMLLGSAWLIWDSGEDARSARERGPAAQDPATSGTVLEDPEADAGAPAPTRAAPAVTATSPAPTAPPQRPADGRRAIVRSDPSPVVAAPTRPAATLASTPTPTPAPSIQQPPPQAALPPPAEEALPPVAALDAATRASLPALKLSMHVYADEPARRFAIVDGQRVGEGALLGSGRVAQIRRDGVVIEVNGRRVLLPKP